MSRSLEDLSEGLLTPAKRLSDEFENEVSPDCSEIPSVSSSTKLKMVKVEADP